MSVDRVLLVDLGGEQIADDTEITAMLQDPAYSSLPIRAITSRTVFRWRKGLTLPRNPQLVAMLTELSGGRVTADSFMAGSMS
jgi:hypothetical protein